MTAMKRKCNITFIACTLAMVLGMATVVSGADFEKVRRFPKPAPRSAQTSKGEGLLAREPTAKVLDHRFSDMVGKPDRKGSRHFNGHPAEIAALTLSHLGLMNGYADGTFRPDNTITRAEFAAVVSRAFKRGPGDGRFGSEAPLKEEDAVNRYSKNPGLRLHCV